MGTQTPLGALGGRCGRIVQASDSYLLVSSQGHLLHPGHLAGAQGLSSAPRISLCEAVAGLHPGQLPRVQPGASGSAPPLRTKGS